MTLSGQVDLKKILPPNPNVAALMKADITPVTEYAGIPNVSIPLYTITEDNINIPIFLSYHTGGIQVGEESSSVGLGWALNAGGVISRTINGFADFGETNHSKKYYQGTEDIPDPVLTTYGNDTYFNLSNNAFIRSDANCNYLVDGVLTYYYPSNEGADYDYDHMPDTYNYSFNGYSGSFVMKKDGTIYLLEKNGLDINWQFESGINNYSFSIITEDGTKYSFDDWGKTNPEADSGIVYISTWYLSKITTINGNEVNFIYDNKGKSYPLKTFVQSFFGPGTWVNEKGPQTSIDDIYLTEIQFKNGKVKFNYSILNERQDISNAYFLKNIEILDINQGLIKQHDFHYSYFGSASANSGSIETGDYSSVLTINPDNPDLNLRLKLNSISSNGKTHEFEYFDNPLIPNKTTMSQDYWGFYNGITNANSFVAFGNESMYSIPIKAKRYPIESKAKLFSLKKITYPTKGYTEFDYESNTYNTSYNSIPYSFTPLPATIEKSDYVMTNGGATIVSKIISPKGEFAKMKIDLAIYGSNVAVSSGDPYPNRFNHPFNFQSDMYVKYTNNATGSSYTQYFSSEQASIDFENTGQAFHSVTMDIGTPPIGGYTFEVYFNDHNQLYFGQAKVTVTWDETEVSDTKKYSLGGGLRIKSITDFNHTTQQLRKRNYNYHYFETINNIEVERSYGLLKDVPKPNLDRPLDYPSYDPDGDLSSIELVARVFSHNSFSKDFGSYVGYNQVSMSYEDNFSEDNGKTTSKFYNYQDFEIVNNLGVLHFESMHKFPPVRLPHNGVMYKQENYKRNTDDTYTLVSETDFGYKINGMEASSFEYDDMFNTSDYLMTAKYQYLSDFSIENNCLHSTFQFHPLYVSLIEKASQIETIYDTNGQNPLVTEQNFFYENPAHFQVTKTETNDSEGNYLISKTRYPNDFINSTTLYDNTLIKGGILNSYTAIDRLKSNDLHQNAIPIQVETFKRVGTTESLLSLQRTNFVDLGSDLVLPSIVQTLKGDHDPITNPLQARVNYSEYDDFGNPQEISKEGGSSTVYLWSYNNTLPVAKIDNATFSEVESIMNSYSSGFITSLGIEIDKEIIAGNLVQLRNDLATGVLSNALVSTYIYDPLIGTVMVTAPNGLNTHYQYDSLNRLKAVLNNDEDVVQYINYNYKSEPEIILSINTYNFSDAAGSKSVTVTSNRNWIVSEPVSWLSLSTSSGSNNGSFIINCTANTGSARSATVTVTAEDITQTISVTQDEKSLDFTLTQLGTSYQTSSFSNSTINSSEEPNVIYHYYIDSFNNYGNIILEGSDSFTFNIEYDYHAYGWVNANYNAANKTIELTFTDPNNNYTNYASVNVTANGITKILSIKFTSVSIPPH